MEILVKRIGKKDFYIQYAKKIKDFDIYDKKTNFVLTISVIFIRSE